MIIEMTQLIEGAKKARGLTVIIDVFRAFTVACYVTNNGAEHIIPIGDVRTAYRLQEDNPDYILIGERKGVQLEGFDFGNSPYDVEKVDFTGKTIVHTTSAGTQGIIGAINADEIITGSFVNAEAIVRYINHRKPEHVTLVAMGNNGDSFALEDDLCAKYIKALLEGQEVQDDLIKERLRQEDGAKFFDPKMNHIFPIGDFDLCMDFNKFDFVLKVESFNEGLVELVQKNI